MSVTFKPINENLLNKNVRVIKPNGAYVNGKVVRIGRGFGNTDGDVATEEPYVMLENDNTQYYLVTEVINGGGIKKSLRKKGKSRRKGKRSSSSRRKGKRSSSSRKR